MERLRKLNMKVTTLDDQLRRAKDGHVTKWLVDGIFVDSGLNLVFAPTGTAKSLVSLDLAISAC